MSDLVERMAKCLEGVTPGPWEIQDDWTIELTASPGVLIAKLPHPNGKLNLDAPANARFIAAARAQGTTEAKEE